MATRELVSKTVLYCMYCIQGKSKGSQNKSRSRAFTSRPRQFNPNLWQPNFHFPHIRLDVMEAIMREGLHNSRSDPAPLRHHGHPDNRIHGLDPMIHSPSPSSLT